MTTQNRLMTGISRYALGFAIAILGFGPAITANAEEPSNWRGFYLGGDVGYDTGTSSKEVTTTGNSSGDFTVGGGIGGGTIGYNAQRDALVVGLEGDISADDVGGRHACSTATYTCETDNHWLATIRPRVGYSFAKFMPYVTWIMHQTLFRQWCGPALVA